MPQDTQPDKLLPIYSVSSPSLDSAGPASRSSIPLNNNHTWDSFLYDLAMRESSNNPSVENAYGYLGLYQLGESALAWVGFYDPGKAGTYPENGAKKNNWLGTFLGKYGVSSKEDYLADPSAQTQAVSELIGKNGQVLDERSLLSFDGSWMNGIENTLTGMLAAAHLRGVGNPLTCLPYCIYNQTTIDRTMGLQEYLESGGRLIPHDETGTPLTEYIQLFNGHNIPVEFAPTISAHQVYPRNGAPAANPALDSVCLTLNTNWGDNCLTMRAPLFTDTNGEQQISFTAAIDRTGADDKTIRDGINPARLTAILRQIKVNANLPRTGHVDVSAQQDLFATGCSQCAGSESNACMSVQLSSDELLPQDYVDAAQPAMDDYVDRLTCGYLASDATRPQPVLLAPIRFAANTIQYGVQKLSAYMHEEPTAEAESKEKTKRSYLESFISSAFIGFTADQVDQIRNVLINEDSSTIESWLVSKETAATVASVAVFGLPALIPIGAAKLLSAAGIISSDTVVHVASSGHSIYQKGFRAAGASLAASMVGSSVGKSVSQGSIAPATQDAKNFVTNTVTLGGLVGKTLSNLFSQQTEDANKVAAQQEQSISETLKPGHVLYV